MASKLSLTLRLSIYFSRDHSTLPAEIRTHSEVPGPCSLQVHKDLFAIKRQTPLIALFPDAFQLDYGAYLTRAQIQLLEIYWMVFRCFEKLARVKPCRIQLCAQANRIVFSEVCKHEWYVRATSSLLMFSKRPLVQKSRTAH